MATALIGMGSNTDDRAGTLERALGLLANQVQVRSVAASRWHETAPIGGPGGQGPFLNAAARLETSLEPEFLLKALQQIENQLGRKREVRWDQRTLDLDLLLYDDLVVKTPTLEVPHPMMACRRFVLEPAAQVAAQMVHPVLSRSVESLLAHLEQAVPYAAIMGGDSLARSDLAGKLAMAVSTSMLVDYCGDTTSWNRASRTADEWIKFLAERVKSLRLVRKPAANAWMLSGFWLGEVCLALQDEVPETTRSVIADAWWRAQSSTLPAKLVLVIDPEQQFTPAGVAACWRKLTSQPMTPFLLLQSSDLNVQVDYAAAAMKAMQ